MTDFLSIIRNILSSKHFYKMDKYFTISLNILKIVDYLKYFCCNWDRNRLFKENFPLISFGYFTQVLWSIRIKLDYMLEHFKKFAKYQLTFLFVSVLYKRLATSKVHNNYFLYFCNKPIYRSYVNIILVYYGTGIRENTDMRVKHDENVNEFKK